MRREKAAWGVFAGLVAVSLGAAGVLGYHPYSEDGGIYVAEIKRALNPRLFPWETAFVAGHLGGSGFTPGVVWMVRTFGLRLEWVLLGLHMLSILGLLGGVWLVSRNCYPGARARWGAVGAVGLCLTLPVAGTSLLVMDPYVTARSVSLGLAMLGLGGVLGGLGGAERRWRPLVWGTVALAGAVMAHPLMGGYAVGAAALLVCWVSRKKWVRVGGVIGFACVAGLAAGVVQATAAAESAEYARVAASRYYWFISEWHWYEVMGLVAPLGILGWVARREELEGGLARMAITLGGVAVLISLIFAREAGRVHAVARMQPLRCFQVVYVVLFVVLGAWVGERVLGTRTWRWGLAAAVVGGTLFAVQRGTYPGSDHFEVPGGAVRNRWEEAFLWVRRNTPEDALFGLDADYVKMPGEDAQGFRAVAERSALPDFSKDGGQAAILPELTEDWVAGQRAQERLTEETDAERVSKLRPLGVGWIVIGRTGLTGFACPYANDVVKVCRMP